MSHVAFVGLGAMGLPMAMRLVDAGLRVSVHNRTPDKAERVLAAGARWAASPAAAARGASAVIVMVSDDEASRDVWCGPEGVLTVEPGQERLAIECSTVSHGWSTELAGLADQASLRFVDCPVTGLPEHAAAGQLTLLVGAAAGDLELARPFLRPLADRILHFGPPGAGTAYKLLVNLMGGVQIAGVAEGLAMAEAAGLDLDVVMEAIASGQAASPQVVRNGNRMAAGNHTDPVTFSGRLRHKDVTYGLRLAKDLGVEAALGRTTLAMLDALVSSGLGDLNESSIVEVVRRGTRVPSGEGSS